LTVDVPEDITVPDETVRALEHPLKLGSRFVRATRKSIDHIERGAGPIDCVDDLHFRKVAHEPVIDHEAQFKAVYVRKDTSSCRKWFPTRGDRLGPSANEARCHLRLELLPRRPHHLLVHCRSGCRPVQTVHPTMSISEPTFEVAVPGGSAEFLLGSAIIPYRPKRIGGGGPQRFAPRASVS
jgi:hypothetical protein